MVRQEKHKHKNDNEVTVFLVTFLKFFLAMIIILTPILSAVNTVTDILDSTPG